MSDRLYLTCRIRGASDLTLLRQFEKVLVLFPFSKLAKRGPVLRVYAHDHTEPPQLEREFELGATVDEILKAAGEVFQSDCRVEVETGWDLWTFQTEWKLQPATVTLAVDASRFEDPDGDHLHIDFGLDSQFLPSESIEGSLARSQSNVKSLLHFVQDVEKALPLESRQLRSESGANFAAELAQTLARFQ
jgi:hypothetical protein